MTNESKYGDGQHVREILRERIIDGLRNDTGLTAIAYALLEMKDYFQAESERLQGLTEVVKATRDEAEKLRDDLHKHDEKEAERLYEIVEQAFDKNASERRGPPTLREVT
jgi:hypothetical protein